MSHSTFPRANSVHSRKKNIQQFSPYFYQRDLTLNTPTTVPSPLSVPDTDSDSTLFVQKYRSNVEEPIPRKKVSKIAANVAFLNSKGYAVTPTASTFPIDKYHVISFCNIRHPAREEWLVVTRAAYCERNCVLTMLTDIYYIYSLSVSCTAPDGFRLKQLATLFPPYELRYFGSVADVAK